MASFSVTSRGTSTLAVQVSGMDGSFGRTRYFRWYRNGTRVAQTTAAAGATTKTYTYSGLSSGTTYSLSVGIYDSDNSTLFTTLYTTGTTTQPTPSISSFSVSQASVGSHYANCSWSASNIASNSSYKITVSGYTKVTGTTSGSGSAQILLDYYQTYTAILSITSNGTTVTRSASFTMKEPADPTLSSITASAVTGARQARVGWSITNNKSGTTVTISAKQSTASAWVVKVSSVNAYTYSSSTFAVDLNANYDFRVQCYYNGTLVGTLYKYGIYISLTKPAAWAWTTAETNAFNNNGEVTALTQTRWNAFISWANECIYYVTGSSDGYIKDTYKMGSDKIMYATSFRQVCSKISSIVTITIPYSSIASGSIIYGWYFTHLSSKLNSLL